MGIVSLYSEQDTAANCVHYMESWLYQDQGEVRVCFKKKQGIWAESWNFWLAAKAEVKFWREPRYSQKKKRFSEFRRAAGVKGIEEKEH